MAKSLASVRDVHTRAETIKRRINSGTMGLGFWAAVDALKNRKQVVKVQERLGDHAAPVLIISRDEADTLLEKANGFKQAAGVPENWIFG